MVENEKVTKLLKNPIPKDITEHSDLIYAEAKLVNTKIGFPTKEFEHKDKSWKGNKIRKTNKETAKRSDICKEGKYAKTQSNEKTDGRNP